MHSPSPVIFSHSHLYLRKIFLNDAEFLLKLNSNEQVMRFTGEIPWTSIQQAKKFILHNHTLSLQGIERWIVCKTDNTPIGLAGYRVFDDLPEQWDISFRFLPEYWNQGYAFITVQILTYHALYVCKRNSLRAQVHQENLASAKVLEKCGYRLDHYFTWGEMTWRCYFVKLDDFQALPELLVVR